MTKPISTYEMQRRLLLAQAYVLKAMQVLGDEEEALDEHFTSCMYLSMQIGEDIFSEENPYATEYLKLNRDLAGLHDGYVHRVIARALEQHEEEEARFAASLYGLA
jgi:hypothetical protein